MAIADQIIAVIKDHGPMKIEGMMEYIKDAEQKSVHNKALDLQKEGILVRDDVTQIWSFVPGYVPESTKPPSTKTPPGGSGGESPPGGGDGGTPLNPKQAFESLLKSSGVDKLAAPTIATLFFNGDIDKLTWLREVINRNAAGYVSPSQARLIISSWSATRGLPYDPNEFVIEGEGKKGPGRPAAEEVPLKPSALDKLGIAWTIERNKSGDWVPVPAQGGHMTHGEAVEAAERRATIDQLGRHGDEEDSDAGTVGTVGKGGKKAPQSLAELLMLKMLDKMFPEGGGSNGADNPLVAALQQQNTLLANQVQDMKDQAAQARLDKIEENIAIIAARNPWDDPAAVQTLRQRLGVGSSTVTDSSPAVQLLKDSTDKLDKNVERMTGLFERVLLKSEAFNPEEKRSPAEREQKAGQLLDKVTGNQKSVELRRRTFGT